MNTPQFVFNATPPPPPTGVVQPPQMPFGAPPMAGTFPGVQTPPAAPNWKEKAAQLIKEKVLIDSKPITTPQMEVWAYQELVKRLGGNAADADQRLYAGLQTVSVGAVNLGNEQEEGITDKQRQEEILQLIPKKLTWQGNACLGNGEALSQIAGWLLVNIPSVAGLEENKKLVALHNWISAIKGTYELDEATRAKQVQTPPANPVSDQKTPQKTQEDPKAETEKEDDSDDATDGEFLLDPVDGYKCKNLRGLKTRVTRTHKSDWGPFCTQHGLDPLTGKKLGDAVAKKATLAPAGTPPASEPLPALVGQGAPVDAEPINSLYGADGKPTPAYAAAQQAAQQADNAMPVPPKQQPSSPVQFTPTFIPQQTAPVQNVPQITQPQITQPQITQPQITQPQITQPQITQPHATQTIAPGLDRKAMAKALGGEVHLIVCRLLEVNNVPLAGYTDANQLALLAEKQAREELRIVDLAQGQYATGKHAAQRHFAELLTKYPQCYMLMNGFEPILPAGYLEILIARTTYVYHVSERGGAIEIKF